ELSCTGQAAAEDEGGRVEDFDDVGHADGGEARGVVDDRFCDPFALLGALKYFRCFHLGTVAVAGIPGDGTSGSDGLEGTQMPVASDGATRQDGDVADLACDPLSAVNDLVPDEQ